MGVALLGVGIGTLSLAERYVPSGVAALLVAVMPLWIIVFRMRAGERPATLTLIGVATGMTGLVLMLLPGGTQPVSGGDADVVLWSLAIMCSSFCWAFFSWRSARYPLPANPLVTTDVRDGHRRARAGRQPASSAENACTWSRPPPTRGGRWPTSSPHRSAATPPTPGCSATHRCR